MMKKAIKVAGSAWGQRITILLLICIFMAIFQPVFLKPANASSILLAISINGIMACGMMFTVLVGGLDLSIGSMVGMSASMTYAIAGSFDYSTAGFFLGVAVTLLFCLVVGWINGFFVTKLDVPPFVVTMAMKYLVYGLIYMVTRGFFIYPPSRGIVSYVGNYNVLGVPMPVIIFIVILIISAFVLGKTSFGRKLYIIGGNRNVANLVGIKADMNIQAAYMISSVSAGFGGIILGSMTGQIGQTTGVGYEGNVLTAMVVGGINLAGGEGGVAGAVFGALFVGVLNNAMLLLSISTDYQTFVQGVIIIGAMALNMYANRRSKGLSGSTRKKPKENPTKQSP